MTSISFLDSARRTIAMERDAVSALLQRIDGDFERACALLLACQGRIVVTGMGKPGHVGNKIAATLASTGTPAMFVHPAEASHGDIGMITANDVVLALSNSGNTAEIITLLPLLKRLRVPIVAISGNSNSALAKAADVNLDAGVAEEACPLGLAPTSSTTVALVLGDALAIALLEARGFTAEDFAFSHPGGALGRKLLLKVEDVMRTGKAIPKVTPDTPLSRALLEISAKGLAMTAIVDGNDVLLGIFTDGDLRRSIDNGIDIRTALIGDVMNRRCKTIDRNRLAVEALNIMDDYKIVAMLVVDEQNHPIGAFHVRDLTSAGLA